MFLCVCSCLDKGAYKNDYHIKGKVSPCKIDVMVSLFPVEYNTAMLYDAEVRT